MRTNRAIRSWSSRALLCGCLSLPVAAEDAPPAAEAPGRARPRNGPCGIGAAIGDRGNYRAFLSNGTRF